MSMRPVQAHPQSIYTPKLAKITRAENLTEMERLIRFEFVDGNPLGQQVGQFVEVSVLGVGEAPLTVASSPHEDSYFEICVRRTGNVTNALHRLDVGAVVGIRGPLGRGFPVDDFCNQNLLIVAGGIGIIPLRPVIHYAMAYRQRFDHITILYGVKHPKEVLFKDDIAAWSARPDVDLRITVDRPVPGWTGHVGVVTTFFPEMTIDPRRTVALIVGPSVMYKFVLLGLSNKGLPDHKIFMSFERHMKCGVGKCGHCQINRSLVCQQGPTFSYADIKDLREAIG